MMKLYSGDCVLLLLLLTGATQLVGGQSADHPPGMYNFISLAASIECYV